MFRYFTIFLCFLSGCGTYIEDRRSIDYAPIYTPTEITEEQPDFVVYIQQIKEAYLRWKAVLIVLATF